jgi:hypothetical protein
VFASSEDGPRFGPSHPRLYNEAMARGWESKSVEEQQAEARAQANPSQPKLTPSQIQKKQQIESLTLSRSRVEQQLTAAHEPRHQEMLRRALADLDEQIRQIAESS